MTDDKTRNRTDTQESQLAYLKKLAKEKAFSDEAAALWYIRQIKKWRL